MATELRADTLADLADGVEVPGYDRSRVRAGVVHFGVGGFHRAHLASYTDRLLARGETDWGICGVGVLEADAEMRDVLESQDHLYTLVLKHADGTLEPRVIGSLVDYLYAPDDPERVIAAMADGATRIVSLTVTEGGYFTDDVTGELDREHPAVAADLEGDQAPETAFGLITAALARRRDAGLVPFTVMSCDNLPGNGSLTKGVLLEFARARSDELAGWVEREGAFPNAMVDRITPGTTDDDRDELRERFGIVDRWPVVCEPFTQWVLEDSFSAGRPAYDEVGAQLVPDVEPYELMKLRLLNAGHQALGYFGRLCGYELVHEAAQDETIRAFVRDYMEREGTPTLPTVPGVDVAEYRETLLERFANPEIRDTLARLCAFSSDRIPKWLLPVVRDNLVGGEIVRAAAVVASWARYAEGVDEHGEEIEVVDQRREDVMERAKESRDEPAAFLADRDLFGDLADDERFVGAYTAVLRSLHEQGARATLEALVAGELGEA